VQLVSRHCRPWCAVSGIATTFWYRYKSRRFRSDTPSLIPKPRGSCRVFDFSAVGLQGYGPTNEGNFEPAVDTLAILTEKFQGLRSTVNSLQTAFAGIRGRTTGQRWCYRTAGPSRCTGPSGSTRPSRYVGDGATGQTGAAGQEQRMVLHRQTSAQDKTAWIKRQTGAQDKTAWMVLQGKQRFQDKTAWMVLQAKQALPGQTVLDGATVTGASRTRRHGWCLRRGCKHSSQDKTAWMVLRGANRRLVDKIWHGWCL
jgi:hypothetical protein